MFSSSGYGKRLGYIILRGGQTGNPSVRDTMLMQFTVNCIDRLVERALEECLVIVLAVMMGHSTGLPLGGAGADVLQASVQQCQHVLQGRRAMKFTSVAGYVDRRSMRHDA